MAALFVGACAARCPDAPAAKAQAAPPTSATAEAPKPAPPVGEWFLAGNAPRHYEFAPDDEIKPGKSASMRLKAITDPGMDFGTVMRSIPAAPYRGKRVRFSASVRTSGVSGWTGLWMRIDLPGGLQGPFDNMQDRPIGSTTEWSRYEVVLDVPDDAISVNYGMLQAGAGTSWLAEHALDAVDESVTASPAADPSARAHCDAHALKATGSDPLIEDVEDGDRVVRKADGRSGGWWLARADGCRWLPGDPSPAPPGGLNTSRFAIRGGARDCKDWGFAIGFGLNGPGGLCAYDASVYDGVYFWARSGQGEVALRFRAGTRQTEPADVGGDGTCDAQKGGCWDEYAIDLKLTPTWTLYSVKWAELKQAGWGKAVPFNLKELSALHWTTAATPTDYREIWVDQVGFFKGTPPKAPPH